MSEERLMYTVAEVADLTGYPRQAVYEAIRSAGGPGNPPPLRAVHPKRENSRNLRVLRKDLLDRLDSLPEA